MCQSTFRPFVTFLVLLGRARLLIGVHQHTALFGVLGVTVRNRDPGLVGVTGLRTRGGRHRGIDRHRRECTDYIGSARRPFDLLLMTVPRSEKLAFDQLQKVGTDDRRRAHGHENKSSCLPDVLTSRTPARRWFSLSNLSSTSTRAAGDTVNRSIWR